MSDRYKYAINGIYKCENFAEQVEQNRFPENELGSLGGISGWCFTCTLIAENGQAFLYPSIFGMVRCTHEMKFYMPLKFYCSSEILNFHCPQFVEEARKIVSSGLNPWDFFRCLQILHGVRLQIDYCDSFDLLNVAHFFNLSNVIRYCDQFCTSTGYYQFEFISFDKDIKFNLRHTLTEKLRNRGWKDVVEIAKKLNLKEATGEAMKTFVAKILYT
ncbi:unnamed protein product [Caenorhabditis brenneri]